MYTMVLMMAASSAGDTADFGFRKGKGGCTGAAVATAPAGCTGTVVAAPVYAAPAYGTGCTGTVVAAPVSAGYGCTGSAATGGRDGLFGGLKGKLFGRRSNGCTGAVVAAPAAYGYGGGCIGSAPIYGTGHAAGGVIGCEPTIGTVAQPGVGGPVIGTPVVMPPVTPKSGDPKKDDKKVGNES